LGKVEQLKKWNVNVFSTVVLALSWIYVKNKDLNYFLNKKESKLISIFVFDYVSSQIINRLLISTSFFFLNRPCWYCTLSWNTLIFRHVDVFGDADYFIFGVFSPTDKDKIWLVRQTTKNRRWEKDSSKNQYHKIVHTVQLYSLLKILKGFPPYQKGCNICCLNKNKIIIVLGNVNILRLFMCAVKNAV
jgi:hypothetical protein